MRIPWIIASQRPNRWTEPNWLGEAGGMGGKPKGSMKQKWWAKDSLRNSWHIFCWVVLYIKGLQFLCVCVFFVFCVVCLHSYSFFGGFLSCFVFFQQQQCGNWKVSSLFGGDDREEWFATIDRYFWIKKTNLLQASRQDQHKNWYACCRLRGWGSREASKGKERIWWKDQEAGKSSATFRAAHQHYGHSLCHVCIFFAMLPFSGSLDESMSWATWFRSFGWICATWSQPLRWAETRRLNSRMNTIFFGDHHVS